MRPFNAVAFIVEVARCKEFKFPRQSFSLKLIYFLSCGLLNVPTWQPCTYTIATVHKSADDLNTSRNVSWSFATDILLNLKSNIVSWFSFTRPFAAAKSVRICWSNRANWSYLDLCVLLMWKCNNSVKKY